MALKPEQRELVIIGGGPGGYAAAFAAADRGMAVTLINDEPRLGGTCLLRGCIPSKALLHTAKLLGEAREARGWGLVFQEPRIDLPALRTWRDGVVDKLAGGVGQLAQLRKVERITAHAEFLDSHTLRLSPGQDGQTPPVDKLRFDHCILATGSLPAIPAALRVDDPRVLDSTAALTLPDDVGNLLIVGGGYIGLEMGTVFASMGSVVTVVELTDGLLPGADRDLVKPLHARLDQLFESIKLSTKVEALAPAEAGVAVRLAGPDGKSEQIYDHVLVAVGRRPNSGALSLRNTAVEQDERGFIKVDQQRRTTEPHIFAIGDVAGEPMLAHKATREGKVAVEVLAGEPAAFDSVAIPAVVFTDPEIAWCGLTENQAKAAGLDVQITRFPWTASGRAATLGRSDGLTKLIFDRQSQRVLGVGIVGPGAGELIAEGVAAVETAMVARDLAECIHAHPTLSETVGEAAEMLFGQATHLFQPKRK